MWEGPLKGFGYRFDARFGPDAADLQAIFLVKQIDRTIIAEPGKPGIIKYLCGLAALLEEFGVKGVGLTLGVASLEDARVSAGAAKMIEQSWKNPLANANRETARNSVPPKNR